MIALFNYAKLGSTQDQAFALLAEGQEEPFIVSSSQQTSPRGRQGREWEEEAGRSKSFSLAYSFSDTSILGLSPMLGCAVCDFLDIPYLKIKWPNDLMGDDSKLGGILVESKAQSSKTQVVIGIGINLYPLQMSSYQGIQKNFDIQAMADFLVTQIERFEMEGFRPWKEFFEDRMWGREREVEFQIGSERKRVKLKGVNERGELRTEADGLLALHSNGEIIYA